MGRTKIEKIACEKVCVHYSECYPFVNPVGCTKIELWDDIAESVKHADYIKLLPDSTILTGTHHLAEIKDE